MYIDRQSIIDSLTRHGYRYNYDKYTDQQLFRIWQDKRGKLSPMEIDQMERELANMPKKAKCENCGRVLDESGCCPVCEYGETEYEIYSSTNADSIVFM